MEKAEADAIKDEIAQDHKYDLTLEHISEEELEEQLTCYQWVSNIFKYEITDFCLDMHHDLWCEDTEQLIRVFWFSQGMTDSFIALNINGQIVAQDPDIPMRLLKQVAETLERILEED